MYFPRLLASKGEAWHQRMQHQHLQGARTSPKGRHSVKWAQPWPSDFAVLKSGGPTCCHLDKVHTQSMQTNSRLRDLRRSTHEPSPYTTPLVSHCTTLLAQSLHHSPSPVPTPLSQPSPYTTLLVQSESTSKPVSTHNNPPPSIHCPPNMYTHIYICVYIYIHTYIYTHIHIHK
jgi:hypothetical protein